MSPQVALAHIRLVTIAALAAAHVDMMVNELLPNDLGVPKNGKSEIGDLLAEISTAAANNNLIHVHANPRVMASDCEGCVITTEARAASGGTPIICSDVAEWAYVPLPVLSGDLLRAWTC